MTGGLAAYGEQVRNGAQAAVDEINSQGGLLGEKVVLKVYDSAGDPKQGVSAANLVIGDGIHFVVGPVMSGIAMPVSEMFAESGTVMITPTATVPALTDRGLWNVFRTCGRDDQQGDVAAAYIAEKFKDRRIAILHDKAAYGQGLAERVKASLNAVGVNEVIFEGINPGEKDYSVLIARLKAANIDFIYYGGYHVEAGLIIRQSADAGMKAILMGGDGLSSSEFWSLAGPAATGTLMTNSPDFGKRPSAAAVVEKLAAAKIPAEAFTLNAYAAVQVIKAAAEKVGKLEQKAVAEALHGGMPIDTVIGNISYSAKGDLSEPNFVVYEWKDGRASEIQQ